MSQTNDKLENLKEHRDAILLAEIGALIHDLGKLSEEFIKQVCEGVYLKFDHEEILKNKYKQTIWFNSNIFELLRNSSNNIIGPINVYLTSLKIISPFCKTNKK